MGRYWFSLICLGTLATLPAIGCGDTTSEVRTCQPRCYDGNECTGDVCDPGSYFCDYPPVEDGTSCADGAGTCQAGSCAGTFACTEAGIRSAIVVGYGPHRFACDGPTTVVTESEIIVSHFHGVVLDGEGNLTVDGNEDHRVFAVPKGHKAELHRFVVTGGLNENAFAGGGGIRNDGTLTITNSIVSRNTASEWAGGGIANYGTLTMTNSAVSENTRGGVYNGGTLTMTNSTVSRNFSSGSLNLDFGILNTGTLTMTNSTVSRNLDFGIWDMGTLTMTNSTVSANTALRTDASADGGTVVSNSLLEGGCEGLVTSNGYNIESPQDTCGFDQRSDQVNVSAEDLNLGPLADNGGPTETHALMPDGIAIDAIPEAICVDADGEPLITDQRGVTRPQGGVCDVGAFELEQP